METHFIHINDFCKGHEIELSFIIELQEYELIQLKIVDNDKFIALEELPKVEKLIRLHQDLSINIEGIEAIYYLLERSKKMRQEIQALKQRLRIHEEL
mgnify:CR=1 FL=1|tara:strand:- start:4537 stop:4830 length:294 start_codon:yes stop_codon:yes gene_type:complete